MQVRIDILATVGSNYRIIGFSPNFCGIGFNISYLCVIVIPVLVTNSAMIILMLLVIYRLYMVSLMV